MECIMYVCVCSLHGVFIREKWFACVCVFVFTFAYFLRDPPSSVNFSLQFCVRRTVSVCPCV